MLVDTPSVWVLLEHTEVINRTSGGTWVAQLVGQMTLGIGSGHDLTIVRMCPESGSVLSLEESTWKPLSPSVSAPPSLILFLSLKINK